MEGKPAAGLLSLWMKHGMESARVMKCVCTPLPYTLYMGRGNACSWHTVIKQRTDVGFVETGEGRSRRAIG